MKNITTNFIEKVIEETDNNIIDWISLFMFTDAKDLSEIPGFQYTIYTNEFHQVDYVNSYICTTFHFVLLILNETFESGKDGSIRKETNIYLSKDAQSEPTLIDINESLKNKLIKSASKSYETILNSEYYTFSDNSAKYIMKSYLKKDE